MTNFSTNQVMQFYGPATVAAMKVVDLGNGKKQLVGSNGVSSDVVENVEYVNKMALTQLSTAASKTVYVEMNLPSKAQEYIVRVSYPSIAGAGDESWTTKTVSVFGNDSTVLSDKLADALSTVFAEDGVLTAFDGAGSFTISPVINEQRYVRGTHPLLPINFTVSCNTVLDDAGNEVEWATPSVSDSVSASGIYKIMDLEYFAMGERGDQYRGAGWPDVIPTKYEVYPELEEEIEDLALCQIHYSYKGANQNSHKSEKDLYLCGSGAAIDALLNGGSGKPGLVK